MAHSNALLFSRSSTGAPPMVEAHAVESMTGVEALMTPDLQLDAIRFEKTLTPSNVPNGVPNSRCSLEIPPWFVEKHGDKLEEFVILRCGTSAQPRVPWVVRISVSAFPLLRMSCGWQKFAAFNGLRDGDTVVFHLRALSEFEVFVYPSSSGSVASPVSSVEALCKPMQQLLAVGDRVIAAGALHSSTTTTTTPPISEFHPGFPVENGRVSSSLRTSEPPPLKHLGRTVSFSGIDTVYVDTPAVTCNINKDPSRIPNFLFNF